MDKGKLVSSFVLRFSKMSGGQGDGTEPESERWRIKVTHVQSSEETVVTTLEQAMQYIGRIVERG